MSVSEGLLYSWYTEHVATFRLLDQMAWRQHQDTIRIREEAIALDARLTKMELKLSIKQTNE